jgi:DnaJ-class molecular chaperone
MENSRKVFLHEINEFISSSKKIQDKDIIKQKYLDLVKKYHPDVNNEIDKNILNEYMIIITNSFEDLMNNTTSKKQENTENNDIGGFNFDLFMLLLGKITGRGINKENIKDKVFIGYKNLLITEIEKSSKYAREEIELLF